MANGVTKSAQRDQDNTPLPLARRNVTYHPINMKIVCDMMLSIYVLMYLGFYMKLISLVGQSYGRILLYMVVIWTFITMYCSFVD